MKKSVKKVIALAFAGLMCASSLVACNKEQAEEDQTLEVYIIDTGYRTDGVKAIVNSFAQQDWVKEKYPQLEVKFTTNNMEGFALTKVKTPKTNEFDMLFTSDDFISVFEKNSKGENLLLDLTECVYNTEVLDKPGTKYIDAIQDSYIDYLAYTTTTEPEPKYFQVPWVTGMFGILYSEEILAKYGYTDGKTPNTTDEFLALCADIKANPANSGNANGFSIINSANYYASLLYGWWAQYDGLTSYNNFWKGLYTDNRGTTTYSNKIFAEEGRLKSLQVINEMVKFDNKYYDLENQNKGDYMQRQTSFLKGEYAFTVNADWFDAEMKSTVDLLKAEGITPQTIKIMKTPIVSALTDKLDTVKDDVTLSAVISAIDGGATSYEGVSEKDFKRIVEARSIYTPGSMGHAAVIPTKSNSQGVAIDVLKYMATKSCQEAYMKATTGLNMPFDYDYNSIPSDVKESISPLQKARLDYFYNDNFAVNVLTATSRFPLVRFGKLAPLTTQTTAYNTTFSVQGNETTPEKLFNDTKEYWSDAAFDFALLTAGLKY